MSANGGIIKFQEGSTIMNHEYFTSGLFPASRNGKWGFIDKTGKWAIKPKFTWVQEFDSYGIALASFGKKMGIIDKNGQFIGNNRFDQGMGFNSFGIMPVLNNEKWGFINTEGKYVSRERYDRIFMSHGGFRAVMKNGLYGFVDDKGEPATKIQYKEVTEFSDCGYAGVKLINSWFVIDSCGKRVSKTVFDRIGTFSDFGIAPAEKDGKEGYINHFGEFVIEPRYQATAPFCKGGIAFVKESGLWGVIDVTGKYLIEPTYDYFEIDTDGYDYFHVEKDNKNGLVDFYGKEVVKPLFDYSVSITKIGYLGNNSSENGFTFIKLNGEITSIKINSFELFSACNYGLLAISLYTSKQLKNGCIDKNGDFAIPPIYQTDFSISKNGKTFVLLDNVWTCINFKNETVFTLEKNCKVLAGYDDTGIAIISNKKKKQFIDGAGKVLFEADFDDDSIDHFFFNEQFSSDMLDFYYG